MTVLFKTKYLWDGIKIEDNVFIGPNVTFTNDLVPRSKVHTKEYGKIIIKEGASIGANSTIVTGIVIEEYAFIGAGSLVTKNIQRNTLWFGNPAKQKGFITNEGILLNMKQKDKNGVFHSL